MESVNIFTPPKRDLNMAIAFMHKANERRLVYGVDDLFAKAYTRLFYKSIPSGYHADYGLYSKKFCITHPTYGTVAV